MIEHLVALLNKDRYIAVRALRRMLTNLYEDIRDEQVFRCNVSCVFQIYNLEKQYWDCQTSLCNTKRAIEFKKQIWESIPEEILLSLFL